MPRQEWIQTEKRDDWGNLTWETAKFIYEWWDEQSNDGIYEEKIPITSDGRLHSEQRIDGKMNFLSCIGLGKDIKKVDSEIVNRGVELNNFYRFMQQLQEGNPKIEIRVNTDPNGKWVEYSVKQK